MNKTVVNAIIVSTVIIYTLAVAMYSRQIKKTETPPLKSVFTEIEKEFYLEYLHSGQVPTNLAFLSRRAQQLLKVYSDVITWDSETTTLSYTYDRPYPINRGNPIKVLTLGLVSPGMKGLGTAIGPSSITNNAPLYKEAGIL